MDGTFQCPDDRGKTVLELNQENARSHARGIVDTAGPYDPPVSIK